MLNFIALVTTGLQGHCPLFFSVAPFPGLPVGFAVLVLARWSRGLVGTYLVANVII